MQYSETANTRIAAVPQGISIGFIGYPPGLEIFLRVIPDAIRRIDTNPSLCCRIVAEINDVPDLPRFQKPIRALLQISHRQADLHLPGFNAHADQFFLHRRKDIQVLFRNGRDRTGFYPQRLHCGKSLTRMFKGALLPNLIMDFRSAVNTDRDRRYAILF